MFLVHFHQMLFLLKKYKSFDAVLSMYHDQGLIPFKMLSSNQGGVNFTAGLPIIRAFSGSWASL